MSNPAATSSTPRLELATVAVAVVGVALAVATFVRLWTLLGVGLELTDEAYYLLGALHPESIRLFFTAAHWVTGPLWNATGSLYAFRASGLLLVALSGVMLAWGALRLAPHAGIAVPARRLGQAAIMAAGASGALLFGSLLGFTPSYNLMATVFVGIGMGIGMLSIASEGRKQVLLEAATGIVFGLTVLCKFSAGIGMIGLLVMLQVVFMWRRPARLWGPLIVIVFAALTVLLMAALNTGAQEGWRQFRAGLDVIWVAQGDKGMVPRLVRSAADMGGLFAAAAITFWGPLMCFAVAMFWRPLLLGSIGVAWLAAALWLGDHGSAGMPRYMAQPLPWAAFLCIAVLCIARPWMRNPRAVLLALTLAVMPVAAALGTSNPLQVQILGTMAPWGVLLALAGYHWSRDALPAAIASVLFAALVLAQVIGNGAAPYRMAPHSQQTEQVAIGGLGTVQVDARTATMVRELQAAARQCAIAPGAPFLDFYNLPGVGVIVGGVPIEAPWLLHATHAQATLQGADPALLRRAVVAVGLDAAGQRPAPPSQLANFPQGRRLCGQTTSPLEQLPVQLWAPNL
ncbi:MAG: hypothetical protein V4669_07520 [Pseudomonadota bacterium]